ncbi:MAG: hypothetical protein RQ722_00240 [Desulfuromonadales bacterium]|nr:hypothetical protein [Desulfuromonadales bacterium]
MSHLNLSHFYRMILVIMILLLQACAAQDKSGPTMKVGMHIDAVLEFAMEYPLDWSKDRRVAYGSSNGEVRWTPQDNDNIMLRIVSQVLDEVPSKEDSLTLFISALEGLEITLEEELEDQHDLVLHLTGRTANQDIEAYLLQKGKRIYQLMLTTPPDTMDSYTGIMVRVSQSFQKL